MQQKVPGNPFCRFQFHWLWCEVFPNFMSFKVLHLLYLIWKSHQFILKIFSGIGRKSRGSSSRQTDSRIRRKISQDIRRSSQGSSQGMKNQHLPDCKLKAISFSLYDIGFSFSKMAKSKRLKFSTLFKRKLKNPAMLLTLLFVRHFVCSWYQYLFYWNGLLRTRIWALTVKKVRKGSQKSQRK